MDGMMDGLMDRQMDRQSIYYLVEMKYNFV